MPMFVAGYYMTFATTRRVMEGLHIDDRSVGEDRLEFPINNWLAENNHLNVLAGAIWHPTRGTKGQEDGIILMTRFIRTGIDDPIVNNLKENEKEDVSVKNWLVMEGNVSPEDLEWIGLWDNFWLTRCGTIPDRNDIQGPRKRKIRMATQDEVVRWSKSEGMTLGQFLRHEDSLRAAGKLE